MRVGVVVWGLTRRKGREYDLRKKKQGKRNKRGEKLEKRKDTTHLAP